jgi:hypothetical protein
MLNKYYSLDECFEQDAVFDYLELLEENNKIEFEIIDNDIIKIKDTGLLLKETKNLIKFFEDNDVIEYKDFDDEDDEDDEEVDDEDFDDF